MRVVTVVFLLLSGTSVFAQGQNQMIRMAISGTFDNGYAYASESTVDYNLKTGLVIGAHIVIKETGEAFYGTPAYQDNSMWQWQGQGSNGGSLDLQLKPRTFVNFYGGQFLSHAAYVTHGLNGIVVSDNTSFSKVAATFTKNSGVYTVYATHKQCNDNGCAQQRKLEVDLPPGAQVDGVICATTAQMPHDEDIPKTVTCTTDNAYSVFSDPKIDTLSNGTVSVTTIYYNRSHDRDRRVSLAVLFH
jgi:hypothetical protein